jgi:UDP-N-acetylglucosamine transferase subunit ALG13
VPIINLLIEKGLNVILGASGRPASFLRAEFPNLDFIPIKGYYIRYPSGGTMALQMMRQAPSVLKAIRLEHDKLDKLIDKYEIHAVLSDNRFGMWSDRIPSIYMTHQIMIKAPGVLAFSENLLYHLHRKYMRKFDECWIPDFEENGLSGDLAHKRPSPIPAYFIGPQSRFTATDSPNPDKTHKYMIIISGPEPQRSIFETRVIKQLKESNERAIILSGKPELNMLKKDIGKIEVYAHMNSSDMQHAMRSSEIIISRSGYSSIMDLAAMGLSAVFIPTPGQTEQEYLAKYHKKLKHYYSVSQNKFNLEDLSIASINFSGPQIKADNTILSHRIDQLKLRIEQK